MTKSQLILVQSLGSKGCGVQGLAISGLGLGFKV